MNRRSGLGKKRYIGLLACGLLLPMTGQGFTGQELKAACDAGDKSASGKSGFRNVGDAYDGGLCTGFIHGVIDGQLAGVCSPAGTTTGQEVAFVRKFLAAHPERKQERASKLIADALTLAHPCPKTGDQGEPVEDMMKTDRFSE